MADSYTKKAEQIHQLARLGPEGLSQHLISLSPSLPQVAPGLAPHLYGIANRGIQYLSAKLPKPAAEFPGQEPYEPSKSQKEAWLDQHEIVHDPLSALDHVKNGTLNGKHLEALQAVHPDLLEEMKKKVMENATPKALQGLHSATKIALSKFLGTPLQQSFLPGVIAHDQAQFAMNQSSRAVPSSSGRSSSPQSGLAKLSLGKRSATETQREEATD